MLTVFAPVFSVNLAQYFLQASQINLEFVEEKLRSLGTHQPFLTKSRFQKINQNFLTDLAKPRHDKHTYRQHKPGKKFYKLQQEKLAVYNVMEKLFDKIKSKFL